MTSGRRQAEVTRGLDITTYYISIYTLDILIYLLLVGYAGIV